MAKDKEGRGWLSKMDRLPDEAGHVVAWAALELGAMERPQTEIYAEFRDKLIALQGELGLGFDIPSFSAFNRFSTKKAMMTRVLEQRNKITEALADKLTPKSSDDLTKYLTETLKTLIGDMIEAAMMGRANVSTKNVMELSSALRQVITAQATSSKHRRTLDAEVDIKIEETIETVSKQVGLSTEQVAQIRRDVLGVRE